MSSAAVQQVRPVIECFAQFLSLYGFSPITSETFRLAKFNRDEATIPMWRLIFEMLHFDPINSSQQSSIDRFNQTPKDELVETIKSDVFTRGYTYDQFLTLDNRMQKGSRQLLLCLGWLVYHLRIIEKAMEQCLKSESLLDYDDTSALYQAESMKKSTYSSQEKDLVGQVKQAMRVNSKLRFGLRRLHGLVIENANLQHQIHQCHNMSSLDAYLCHHPHLLAHYMIELDIEHRRLNLLLFWNEHENVFWKWMESVLDQTNAEEDIEDIYEPLAQGGCQRLEAEKQKFNKAIDTLDSALVRLEQLWISDNTNTSVERDVSSMLTTIDTQVSSLFGQLLASNPSSASSSSIKTLSDQTFFLHQPQRLVFAQGADVKEDHRLIKPMDFEHENDRLHALQTNIDQQIEKQRTILDTVSHGFEDVMIV